SQRFVLEEASYVFYGMIYGYQVIYRPPDRFHHQDETFVVIPENPAMIRPDDLDIYHVSQTNRRFYYSVRKPLSNFENARIREWQRADKETTQALGAAALATASPEITGSAWQNLEPELVIELRKAAIDNAIKVGIRSHFRGILRRKPAQIRVHLALSAVPEIAIGQGEILAKVRLSIGQYSLENYETR
ncbi:MAG: hypothetical protein AAF975_06805, partial [Spirochaetota bacterium]